jgi:hypothetical protein
MTCSTVVVIGSSTSRSGIGSHSSVVRGDDVLVASKESGTLKIQNIIDYMSDYTHNSHSAIRPLQFISQMYNIIIDIPNIQHTK